MIKINRMNRMFERLPRVAAHLMLSMMIALVAVGALRAQSVEREPIVARPLGELLNDDGTLRRDRAVDGAIDPRGWEMRTRADGTPYFIPQESASSPLPADGDENWDSGFGAFTMDGNIYAMAIVGADIYVGGTFDNIGSVEAHRLARWDGSGWAPVGGGVDGYVYALTADGAKLYVGGQFMRAGNVDAANVAVWNTAAGGWSSLEGGVRAEGFSYVSSIAASNAELFVGGSFTHAGSLAVNNIARWNKNAGGWSALGDAVANGVNGEVLALKVGNNNLYVGGNFTAAAGATALNAARWDIAQGKWSALGTGLNGYVNAICVAKYGVYFGGGFDSAGTEYVSNLARWSTRWRNAGAYGYVRDMVFLDPLLYVTGEFRRVSRNEHAFNVVNNYVGAYGHDLPDNSADIPTWRSFGNGPLNGMDGYTNAVAISGTTIYFGGSFRVAGGQIQGRIVQWDSVAHRWRAFGVAITGPVQAMVTNGNDLYVAGTFEFGVGNSISTIVKWDGNRWSFVENNIAGIISAMAVDGANLYVGGSFKRIRDVWSHNVARMSLITGEWAPLDTGVVNLDSTDIPFVTALAAHGDDLYVGGYFTHARDLEVNNIARWNIPQRKWYALRNGVSGLVRTIAVDAAGTPYIGGALAVPGDTSTFNLARWDGERWRIVGDGLGGSVAVIKFKGSDLYVGGNFRGAGHDSIHFLARWDGSRWHGFGAGIEGTRSSSVNALAFDGNDLYAAGGFDYVAGDTVGYVARWDGSRWWPLGSGTSENIYAAAIIGKSLFVGGSFLLAGQKPSLYFGRWRIGTSGVEHQGEVEDGALSQNAPNPTSGRTAIGFTTERPGHVTLTVFDINGDAMATLVDGYRPSGSHAVIWDASDAPAGTYYYRLRCGAQVVTRKLVVAR